MTINSNKDELIKDIINFVLNSSDVDKIILSTFIAGMQAKENSLPNILKDKNLPCNTNQLN